MYISGVVLRGRTFDAELASRSVVIMALEAGLRVGDFGYAKESRTVWRAVIHLRERVEMVLSPEAWGMCVTSRDEIKPKGTFPGDWVEPTQDTLPTIKFAQYVFEFMMTGCVERNFYNWDVFVQLEPASGYYHIHVCLLLGAEYQVRMAAAVFRRAWFRVLTLLTEEPIERRLEWLSLTRSKHGRCERGDKNFIWHYLLPKLAQRNQVTWAWSTACWIEKYCVSDSERASLIADNPNGLLDLNNESQDVPVYRSANCQKTLELAQVLRQHSIVTAEQLRDQYPATWASYACVGAGEKVLNAALAMNLALSKGENRGLVDLLTANVPRASLTESEVKSLKIWDLFQLQGFDPLKFGSLIVRWLSRGTGKRNTLWLFGPPSTGKTNFAGALARACPNYGMVNWNNVNFPFNDCVDKAIVFWDEGFINTSIVEQAKAVLGGQEVRVDQKNKGSKPLKPTPVLVTSNVDMTITHSGNVTCTEHRPALRDRMMKVSFNRRLSPDWGLISPEEIRAFLAYCSLHPVVIEPAFEPVLGYGPGIGNDNGESSRQASIVPYLQRQEWALQTPPKVRKRLRFSPISESETEEESVFWAPTPPNSPEAHTSDPEEIPLTQMPDSDSEWVIKEEPPSPLPVTISSPPVSLVRAALGVPSPRSPKSEYLPWGTKANSIFKL